MPVPGLRRAFLHAGRFSLRQPLPPGFVHVRQEQQLRP